MVDWGMEVYFDAGGGGRLFNGASNTSNIYLDSEHLAVVAGYS